MEEDEDIDTNTSLTLGVASPTFITDVQSLHVNLSPDGSNTITEGHGHMEIEVATQTDTGSTNNEQEQETEPLLKSVASSEFSVQIESLANTEKSYVAITTDNIPKKGTAFLEDGTALC